MRNMTRGSLEAGGQTEFRGTYQFEVIPELGHQQGDLVIHKLTASGFVGTSLDGILRNLGIDTVKQAELIGEGRTVIGRVLPGIVTGE